MNKVFPADPEKFVLILYLENYSLKLKVSHLCKVCAFVYFRALWNTVFIFGLERKCFSVLPLVFLNSASAMKLLYQGVLLAWLWASLAMHTASQGLFEFFGKQKQQQSLYWGIKEKPCLSWRGLLAGMSSLRPPGHCICQTTSKSGLWMIFILDLSIFLLRCIALKITVINTRG